MKSTKIGEVKSGDELQCLLIRNGFRKYFNGDERIAQEGHPHFYVSDPGTHIGICTNHFAWDDQGAMAMAFLDEDGQISSWAISDHNYGTVGAAKAGGGVIEDLEVVIEDLEVNKYQLGWLLHTFRAENKWRSRF